MSGICGTWLFEGEKSIEAIVKPAVDSLRYRGPDGHAIWSGTGIGFGQTILASTPEARTEKLPFRDVSTDCVIVADARLDNREHLLTALSLNGDPALIGDGELILRAYLEWGNDCPSHLLGDFAFAIFDPVREEIFCARDHMGMRQINYAHEANRWFAFATTTEALLAFALVPRRINETRIADFFANLEGADFTSTFYLDIVRLPPAHTLRVTRKGIQLERYWQPSAQPILELPSDQAYADAFLTVFEKAVASRLRGSPLVGSMLSGGTDSNAIAATAARLLKADGHKLKTFSAIGPDPQHCLETRLIHLAIEQADFDATTIDHSSLDHMAPSLVETTKGALDPFDGTSMLNRSVYRAAQLKGLNVLLDGASADVLLSSGNRIVSLIAEGKFIRAVREARLESAVLGGSAKAKLFAAAGVALLPLRLKRWRRQLADRWRGHHISPVFGTLRPEFERRTNHAERRQQSKSALGSGLAFGAENLARILSNPNLTLARERYDRIAAQYAIEPRDPFIDLRVVNFCLSLPPSQFQSDGFPKAILRHALAGLVPPEIAWRRERTHLGPLFVAAIDSTTESPVQPDGPVPDQLKQYISGAESDDRDILSWSRYEWSSLAAWLDRHA